MQGKSVRGRLLARSLKIQASNNRKMLFYLFTSFFLYFLFIFCFILCFLVVLQRRVVSNDLLRRLRIISLPTEKNEHERV